MLRPRNTAVVTRPEPSDAGEMPAMPHKPNRPEPGPVPPTREPSDEVVRLATLSHELANLLDGSTRCLSLARSDLREAVAEAGSLEAVGRRLETVAQALERMACMVEGAMRDANRGATQVGGPIATIPLLESAQHAIEVSSPIAAAALVHLHAEFDPKIGATPTGPLYTPILNALRNGIEAVERTGRPGHVHILLSLEQRDRGPEILIRVSDTGAGLPRNFRALATEPAPGGTGIGLALTTAILQSLGGTVRLSNASGGGAVFECACPVRALTRHREESAP